MPLSVLPLRRCKLGHESARWRTGSSSVNPQMHARDPRRKQMRKIKHRFLSGRSGTLSQPGKALPGAKSQCMRLDLTV